MKSLDTFETLSSNKLAFYKNDLYRNELYKDRPYRNVLYNGELYNKLWTENNMGSEHEK